MYPYWNWQLNQKSKVEFQHPHPQSKFILKMNTKLQKFSTVIFEGSDLNTLLSGRDTKAQQKLHLGSRVNMLPMRHAKSQNSTRHTPQSRVPHNFIFYCFFLVLIFFLSFQTQFSLKTKLILFFINKTPKTFLKNIYSTFSVSATPGLPPPAILLPALPATLTLAFSSAGPEEERFPVK